MNEVPRQPRWKTVEYSKTQIILAGKAIKKVDATEEETKKAMLVIDNWRAAHAYPLHVIYTHLRRMAKDNDENIVVAERLKRLDSIIKKLKRQKTMNLWTMQDLGGCRFIVPELSDVFTYANKYKKSRIRHKFIKEYNYIAQPKQDGYRSLHHVYKYYSDTPNSPYNNNMLIELQFRTHLQHLWATAVETMGLYTKQALKAGQGDDETKRFFALTSSLLAMKESTALVPNTPTSWPELMDEIVELNKRKHFLDVLSAIRVVIEARNEAMRGKQGYYLLILNFDTHRLRIAYYKLSQAENANAAYTQIEKNRVENKIDAVLVSVSSFQTLKVAYPNYFSDIGEFLQIIGSEIIRYEKYCEKKLALI